MQAFEDAAKTFRELECELERLDDTYDIVKLDQVEMRAVRILQLLEVQIGGIGSDLYAAVKQRRAAILMGKFEPKSEVKIENLEDELREIAKKEGPFFPEEKPAPKKKTTRKKKSANA